MFKSLVLTATCMLFINNMTTAYNLNNFDSEVQGVYGVPGYAPQTKCNGHRFITLCNNHDIPNIQNCSISDFQPNTSVVETVADGNPCLFIFHNKQNFTAEITLSGFQQFYPRFVNLTETKGNSTVSKKNPFVDIVYEWGKQVNTTLDPNEVNTVNDTSVTPVFLLEVNETRAIELVLTPDCSNVTASGCNSSDYSWDNIGTVNQWIFNNVPIVPAKVSDSTNSTDSGNSTNSTDSGNSTSATEAFILTGLMYDSATQITIGVLTALFAVMGF